MTKTLPISALFSAVLLAACGGGGSSAPAPTPAPATPGAQTITFANIPAATFNDAPVALSATASTPVTFTSLTPANCTITGATAVLVKAGSCTVAADAAADSSYVAAPQVTRVFTINKAEQTINFAALSAQAVGDLGQTVTAAAGTPSSGQPVVLSSQTPNTCTYSSTGSSITVLAPGTCTLSATLAGNDNYNTATPVSRSFTGCDQVRLVPGSADNTPSNWTLRFNTTIGGQPTGQTGKFDQANITLLQNGPQVTAVQGGSTLVSSQTYTYTVVGSVQGCQGRLKLFSLKFDRSGQPQDQGADGTIVMENGLWTTAPPNNAAPITGSYTSSNILIGVGTQSEAGILTINRN